MYDRFTFSGVVDTRSARTEDFGRGFRCRGEEPRFWSDQPRVVVDVHTEYEVDERDTRANIALERWPAVQRGCRGRERLEKE